MKRQTKYYTRMVVMLICGLMLFPYLTSATAEASPSEPVKLKVLLQPYLTLGPIFISYEEGYFAEQGLDIELITAGPSMNTLPLFVQGGVDVYVSEVKPGFLNAILRGAHVRIVADLGHIGSQDDTYATLLVRPELLQSGLLNDLAQLKGLRISTTRASCMQYYLEKVLAMADLTIDDILLQDTPMHMRLEALANGAIDLATAGEPWTTRIAQSGAGIMWQPAYQIVPGLQLAVVAYGPALVEQDREAGKRFMIGFLKGVRQYNEGKTERNVALLAKLTGLDEELVRQAAWPQIHNAGQIHVQSMLDFQQWAMDKGLLDRLIPEKEFWDPSFVEHANQVLNQETP